MYNSNSTIIYCSITSLFQNMGVTSDLQSQMDGDQSPAASGSVGPPLSVLGGAAMHECLQRRQEKGWNTSWKILGFEGKLSHLVLGFFFYHCCSPLSNALVVPFSTSRVRAAMISACWAIDWARSTASAPKEVIIWVPLIKARPCERKKLWCGLFFIASGSDWRMPSELISAWNSYDVLIWWCMVQMPPICLSCTWERWRNRFPMNAGLIFLVQANQI